jgi:hypothetical protein
VLRAGRAAVEFADLGVLCFGLLQDENVTVGVLRQREEIRMCNVRLAGVARPGPAKPFRWAPRSPGGETDGEEAAQPQAPGLDEQILTLLAEGEGVSTGTGTQKILSPA